MWRGRPITWILRASLAALAITAAPAFAQTQLLSITGIDLQPLHTGAQASGQYVSGFNIRTWGVRVLAVCHIPRGWTISAGKNANPEGELSGRAGEGVAFLDSQRVAQLADLFLVRVEDYSPADAGDCARNCRPASFSGALRIGQYGTRQRTVTRRLTASNIQLRPAARCPDPG